MAVRAHADVTCAPRAPARGGAFRRRCCESIEAAIAAAETRTSGEIRFVIETGARPPRAVGRHARRANARCRLSRDLHVWDTELRNGVLIYVLMADRDVEIVADRGAAARISPTEWEAACRLMEEPFSRRPLQGRGPRGRRGRGRIVRAAVSRPSRAIVTSFRTSRRCCSRMPTA